MTEIKYGELAREASKEVEGLDEPLRSIAYKTILDELIGDAKSVESDEKRQTTENGTESAAKRDPIDAFMGRAVDGSGLGDLLRRRGFLVEKSLAVLKLARDEFGIEGLTAGQINEILTRKFRVAGVHSNNISRDLGKSTQYVSRVLGDSGRTRFLLMVQGEQRLREILAKSKEQS